MSLASQQFQAVLPASAAQPSSPLSALQRRRLARERSRRRARVVCAVLLVLSLSAVASQFLREPEAPVVRSAAR